MLHFDHIIIQFTYSALKMASSDRVPIKRFGDGRLYNTEADTYVSLMDLADMLVNGKRIVAEDAETGENITCDILDLLIPPHLREIGSLAQPSEGPKGRSKTFKHDGPLPAGVGDQISVARNSDRTSSRHASGPSLTRLCHSMIIGFAGERHSYGDVW
jgi:hypothetical protein